MSKDNAQTPAALTPAAPRRTGMLILLALTLLFGVGILVLIQNANPVSQFLIKQFAARYDIEILELEDDNSSIDTINLARLRLNYQGSQLKVNHLKLEFVDALAIIKRQQFLSSDLKRISLGDATLSLSRAVVEQILIGSEQTQEHLALEDALSLEQINQWQQTLRQAKTHHLTTQLPEINLGKINIALPDFSSASAQVQTQQPLQAGEKPVILSLSALKLIHQDKLSSEPSTELSTALWFNQRPIITLKAQGNPKDLLASWQLDTELSLRSAHQGLIDMAAYLDNSRAALALEPSQIQSQINRMIAAVGKVTAKGLDIDGRWLTHSELSLQELRFTSQQTLSELTLKLSSKEIHPAPSTIDVNIATALPLVVDVALNTQSLSAKVSPLQLSLSLNAAQRQLMAATFSELSLEQHLTSTLEPWLAKLSAQLNTELETKVGTPLKVNDANTQVTAPISQIELVLGTAELQLPTTTLLSMLNGAPNTYTLRDNITLTSPSAMLNVTLMAPMAITPTQAHKQPPSQTHHQQQIQLSQYQFEYFPLTQNSIQQFDFKWKLSQSSPVVFMPAPLASVSAEQGNLLLEGQVQLEHCFAATVANLVTIPATNNAQTTNPATQLSLTIAPSSQLTLDGINATLGDSHLQVAQLQLTPLQLINDIQTKAMQKKAIQAQISLNAADKPSAQHKLNSQSQLFDQTKLTLADMSLQLKQPQLTLRQPSKGIESIAKAANLKLNLKGTSPLDTSLDTAISSQLAWQFATLDVRRKNLNLGEKNTAALLVLDSLSLEQHLTLNKGVLSSQDEWLLETIPMHSQHWLQAPWLKWPPLNGTAANSTITNKTTFANTSLAGQWQFELDLAQALSVAAKTQTLPENSFIQGKGKFNGSYLLQAVNDAKEPSQRFEFRFEPEFEHLSGDYLDYNFSDASISAKCQLDWQQIQGAKYSKSQLNCPDTKLSATEANLGLRLNQLKLQSDIQLTQDDSKTADNWLQLVTGLSHTEVNLTASGDILDGHFLIPEFSLRIQDSSKGHILLQGLSLEALLAAQPQVGVTASGIFDGVLPAQFTGGKLYISGGQLAARAPGGRIQVSGNPAIDELTQMQPHLSLVFTALEDLNYHQLSSSFDMTGNGDANLNVQVKGNSVGIERPIHLNYSHQENLLQLYRSLRLPTQLQDTIEQSIK
ncbi:YdbH domain-containing protein [Shewanella sp. SR44-3]|uniref:intermembrane phospholipid transport protein YdbH family protein n=1 Tax=Shewanella sp. SR44-3 TaxID=2760936 RepID=UPI0015F82449|nr:YdbH domain-containing protein [Shewanella sp. SR44-3]MBB1270369.1 YdbH domain-containing protein [Shewanella sp. SR44-3]